MSNLIDPKGDPNRKIQLSFWTTWERKERIQRFVHWLRKDTQSEVINEALDRFLAEVEAKSYTFTDASSDAPIIKKAGEPFPPFSGKIKTGRPKK